MTVSTIGSIAEFDTNGVTTNYPFYFKFLANEDLVVTYVNPAGVSSVLTLGTNYTVNGAGNDLGGSIVTTTALAGPGQLVVSREMDAYQQTSLRNQGKFLAETHEDVFDRLTMLIQQALSGFSRSLNRPFGKDYFYAEGRRIANVHDPEAPQDAATKAYTEEYVTNLLSQFSGAINNAANILYAYPGGVARTQQSKNQEFVSFDDFGWTGTSDDTTTLQKALDSGARKIHAIAGKTYRFTELTMSADYQEIVIEPGSILEALLPTGRSITISGVGCSITGGGRIKGQPVFDGANARPTYATCWVTGDSSFFNGVEFDTTPKEAIMFEDSTYHIVTKCRFKGRFPHESYDENTTTNNCAIMYNAPPVSTHPDPFLLIFGNTFEQYIQGCLVANYGAAANNSGVIIALNHYIDCWDHGVYLSRGIGYILGMNSFIRCRRPWVADGIGSIVIGNTARAGSATGSNNQQLVSIRESSDSLIIGNAIEGQDAGMFVDCIETTVMNRNLIAFNNVKSTGSVFAKAVIRLGINAEVCENNAILFNQLHSDSIGTDGSVIELNMKSGFFGSRTRVSDNTCSRKDFGHIFNFSSHSFLEVPQNSLSFTGVAAASPAPASTATFIRVDRSTFPMLDDNKFYYLSGGGNVAVVGYKIESSCAIPKIRRVTCMVIVPVNSFNPLSLGVECDLSGNLLNPNSLMSGKFTWPSGTSSFVVANGNAVAGSIISVYPENTGAAAVIRDLGFSVLPTLGGFTISTAGGTATAAPSNWRYSIF